MRALTAREVLATLIYIITKTHLRVLTCKRHVPEVSDRPGMYRNMRLKLDVDNSVQPIVHAEIVGWTLI